MFDILLIFVVAFALYSYMKGELLFLRDNLEIQLRQARFRIDRLERQVIELEEKVLDKPSIES